MSKGTPASGVSLAELRRTFDASFAAPRQPAAGHEALLALRVGGSVFAARLREVRGLGKLRRCVPLPDPPPGLLGLAGLRGRLVAVFDLAQLLGEAGAEPPEWIVLAGSDEPVGLAVTRLEGQLEAAPEAIHAAQPGAHPFVHELLRGDAGALGILDLGAVVREVQARADRTGPGKER